MQRFRFLIDYHGGHFMGWQKQPNATTVQGFIEKQLGLLNSGNPIDTMGCGRTDTGVHAKYFTFHADVPDHWDPNDLKYKLNKMLLNKVLVRDVSIAAPDFHSRFHATSRTYHYFISRTFDPFLDDRAWIFTHDLDVELMQKAIPMFVGKKNFKAFCKGASKIEDNTFICDLTDLKIEEHEQMLKISISANRFLRNMVRAIVGTLVELGLGRLSLEDIERIIASESRKEAGISVPAHGLFLMEVNY